MHAQFFDNWFCFLAMGNERNDLVCKLSVAVNSYTSPSCADYIFFAGTYYKRGTT